MPYDNPWVNNTPLGSDLANTIDDQIRRLRLDIQQRMDDVVNNWFADPVVPTGGTLVNVKGIIYNDTLSPGNKVPFVTNPVALVSISYNGTTFGGLQINFNELNTTTGENWQVNGGFNFISGTGVTPSNGDTVNITVASSDGINNTITFSARYTEGGTPSGVVLFATLLLTFVDNPS